ncbi:hypothetical protein COV19_01445 [Candidatus Woesearchaeota archaeon CG10_big_fil_rev_8_21_14_0_10_44_13]|nr:MAG: hypothetical protein COV19_01445 [Candidatus Woesearchaeota archaeon CG10_big_fil_rev_8_21_14_0_10_44_13]
MIGKPEWFTYRIFGWGIRPKTWQGWIYLAIVAALIGFTVSAGINQAIKMWVFGVVMGIIILDMLHIMIKLPKTHDERENYHQLLIERNVSFGAVLAILGVALYQTYQNMGLATGIFPFDTSLVIVLGAMVAVKAVSTVYVHMKV